MLYAFLHLSQSWASNYFMLQDNNANYFWQYRCEKCLNFINLKSWYLYTDLQIRQFYNTGFSSLPYIKALSKILKGTSNNLASAEIKSNLRTFFLVQVQRLCRSFQVSMILSILIHIYAYVRNTEWIIIQKNSKLCQVNWFAISASGMNIYFQFYL